MQCLTRKRKTARMVLSLRGSEYMLADCCRHGPKGHPFLTSGRRKLVRVRQLLSRLRAAYSIGLAGIRRPERVRGAADTFDAFSGSLAGPYGGSGTQVRYTFEAYSFRW